jgi:hypothetical protein
MKHPWTRIQIDPNAPAFCDNRTTSGMTYREYFAAMAMQGILAGSSNPDNKINYRVNGGYLHHESVVEDAVKCANALIIRLNAPEAGQ